MRLGGTQEKQLIYGHSEEVKATDWGKDYEFALCIGGPRLKNAQKYVDRALELEASGKFKIYKDLKKDEYYNLLNNSNYYLIVLYKTGLNTSREGDTLGCNVLYRI